MEKIIRICRNEEETANFAAQIASEAKAGERQASSTHGIGKATCQRED